jgi:hypothetical protein
MGSFLREVARCAVIIDPLDEVAIADAILRLVDDVDLRRDRSAPERARAQPLTRAA